MESIESEQERHRGRLSHIGGETDRQIDTEKDKRLGWGETCTRT